MFKKQEFISAFDIEGARVKLAQFTAEDTPRLFRLATLKAAKGNLSGLTEAVQRLSNEYKAAGSRVIVNLPRYKATVKHIKLPSANQAEIESMVRLQAAKQLPIAQDKIISGYKIISTDKNGYSDVMMILVQRDIVDTMLNIFASAGVDIERLALSSEALSLLYLKSAKKNEGAAYISIVDIGDTVSEILIKRDGQILFTRSIQFKSHSEMEKMLADEIAKSLFTCKKTMPDLAISRMILTGRRSIVEKEALLIKKALDVPMAYIDTLKPYPAKRLLVPSKELLANESFTAVLSLGYNYNRLETNLIPQEIKSSRMSRIIKESLIMSAVLFLSVTLGISGIFAKDFFDRKRFLTSIDRRLAETKPKVERLSRLKEITYVIKKQLSLDGSCVDIIRELYMKIPPEITLTIFDYEDARSCILRGTSQKLSDVFKFISTLEKSKFFENVKVRYATKRVVRKRELTDFEIVCQLSQMSI